MKGEIQEQKDLLEFTLNEFKKLITSKELGYNRLMPLEYKEVVGEKSVAYSYGIMTEAMYERLDAFFGLEANYGITRESIGKYIYAPSSIAYLMNEDLKEEDYKNIPMIYTEESAKENFKYYQYDIEAQTIVGFIEDCIAAKTLEDLNKTLIQQSTKQT